MGREVNHEGGERGWGLEFEQEETKGTKRINAD